MKLNRAVQLLNMPTMHRGFQKSTVSIAGPCTETSTPSTCLPAYQLGAFFAAVINLDETKKFFINHNF